MKFLRLSEKEERVTPKGFRASDIGLFARQTVLDAYLYVPLCPLHVPFLYIKSGCPWCDEAEDYLKEHGIAYGKADVTSDSTAFEEMKRLSGQTKAPTMRWDEDILADFGAAELDVFLRERNVVK